MSETLHDINFENHQISFHDLYEMNGDDLKLQYYIKFDNHTWDNAMCSRYIESILIRAPLQPIILHYDYDNSIHTVIDGMNRLSCIKMFMEDQIQLNSLIILKYLNGMSYSKLDRAYQRRIEETYITIHRISSKSDSALARCIALNYM